ncbi:MAG: siderophore-interacting protein [Pseudomonadota bacterium]
MPAREEYPLEATAALPGLAFGPMRSIMLRAANQLSLPVIEDEEERILISTAHGLVGLRQGEGPSALVTVAAVDARWLFVMKGGVVDQLSHMFPDVAKGLRWSDAALSNGLPPNFQFAKVKGVEAVGTAFLRVRIGADDFSRYGTDAIHFRLVLPPPGAAKVEWPTVGENGATVWPSGGNALHRPVYTTRFVDAGTGTMDFDVFIHEGGRVTKWAREHRPNAVVGIVGPGGGGIPRTSHIIMHSDETGFPAVARILDALPEDATGLVTLLSNDGEGCAYPFTAPSGVGLTWLKRGPDTSFAADAIAAQEAHPEHFAWFAGRKADAQKVRAAYKARGADAERAYIAGYWSG